MAEYACYSFKKDVKEMIGHSDISMTDRYSHLTLRDHKSMTENDRNSMLSEESAEAV